MGYNPRLARYMMGALEASAESESLELPAGEFVARNGKGFKLALTVAAAGGIIGLLLCFCFTDSRGVGLIFLTLALSAALVLPTVITYRCRVNRVSLTEKYYILCFKRKKEIFRSDVKYKKVKNNSIKLYGENRKLLIYFDGTTVGLNRIVKLANKKGICKLK